jgi:hypothetical protein
MRLRESRPKATLARPSKPRKSTKFQPAPLEGLEMRIAPSGGSVHYPGTNGHGQHWCKCW